MPLLVIFMANGRISGLPRSLLLVHIREGLASIVDYLVGTLKEIVDLIVDFELPVVFVHVADLAQLVGSSNIFLEVLGV